MNLQKLKPYATQCSVVLLSAIGLMGTAQADQTTDKIFATHTINIGVRDSSVPLSYKLPNGTYTGMAIELCQDVVSSFQKQDPAIKAVYVPVTSDNRIPMLQQGKIDMECGSTTDNETRAKIVDFSVPYYVSGITGVVLATSPVHIINDLPDNSRVVYTKGTTTAAAIGDLAKGFYFRYKSNHFKIIEATDHQSAFNLLTQGKADIILNDDILLYGLVANSANPKAYRLLDTRYSIEPYAVMMRKNNPDFEKVVNRTIIDMMTTVVSNGKADTPFVDLYNKWFMQPIPPKNAVLNVPMSTLLKDYVRFPAAVIGGYTAPK